MCKNLITDRDSARARLNWLIRPRIRRYMIGNYCRRSGGQEAGHRRARPTPARRSERRARAADPQQAISSDRHPRAPRRSPRSQTLCEHSDHRARASSRPRPSAASNFKSSVISVTDIFTVYHLYHYIILELQIKLMH